MNLYLLIINQYVFFRSDSDWEPYYFEYQLWDTLQTFASSVSGSLATAAASEKPVRSSLQ